MKYLHLLLAVFFAILLASCQTTEVESLTEDATPEVSTDEVQLVDNEVVLLDDNDLEYSRSVAGLENEISYDVFQADKNEILSIIEILDESMQNRDYLLWRSYLTPSSISYWSNKMNLQILSTKLPGDDIVLKDLSQYFTSMFIPSRIGREVTEIRYLSTTQVKAVQVQGNTDIIYYDFVKENGKWLVQLQRL